jgi:hypothetical protein
MKRSANDKGAMLAKFARPVLAISLFASLAAMPATANSVGACGGGLMTKPNFSDERIVRTL